MSSLSFANIAESDSRPFALLISATCRRGTTSCVLMQGHAEFIQNAIPADCS